jgi:hypothetical protein
MNAPVLDLRRAARERPIALHGLDALTAAEHSAARRNWRMRMVSEHVSARVFAALVDQLVRVGLGAQHVTEVSAMIDQELHHGSLCARVVAALGGDAVAELPELPEVPRHDDASSAIEALLRNVISVSCCSETVAVSLVGSERELAATGELHDILSQILADEVRHARFGWRLLAELGPELDDATRRGLDRYLVACFAHQIDFHAPFLEMGAASSEAMGVGAPDGASNWSVFVDTMQRVTVPGLERHGLRAVEAWTAAVAMRA